MTQDCSVSPESVRGQMGLVLESRGEYDSQWAAICSITREVGCTPETLRVWVRQRERDTGGGDGGLTTAERQRLKELERENRELRRSNRYASRGFRLFCEGGVRPPLEKVMPLLDKLRKLRSGPVCSELHIAPSTYYHCQQRRHHPDKRSARAQRDDWLKERDTARIRWRSSGIRCA